MPKIADAFVEIEARTGKYKADISNAKRITASFGQSATKSLKAVTAGVVGLGVAAGVAATVVGVKLAKAMISAGTASVKTAIQYDKLKIGLTAVTGSAKEAERQIKRLRVLAQDPGLGFRQALQGSINLQAAGLSAELAERSLGAFGNALAVVGKGAADLDGVSLALTQIANKTSGFGQDIRQLQERLPQMQTALLNAFDGKPVEDLSITGKELIAALVTEFEKLGKAGDSVGNNINNLQTSFEVLKATVGEALLGITSDTSKTLTKIIENITQLIPVWQTVQDDIIGVLQQILSIALKATSQMMKGMFNIVSAAAPLIFKPLVNSGKKFLRDFTAGFGIAVTDVMKALRVINQEQYENFIVGIIETNRDANKIAAADFEKTMDKAFKSAVDTTLKELPRIGKVFGESLSEISLLIQGLLDKTPKIEIEPEPVDKVVESTLTLAGTFETLKQVVDANKAAIISLGQSARPTIAAVEEALFKAKLVAKELGDAGRDAAKKRSEALEQERKAEDEIIGARNARRESLRAKDAAKALASAQKGANDRLAVGAAFFGLVERGRRNLARNADEQTRSEAQKSKMEAEKLVREQVRRVEDLQASIRPAFEDLFGDLFSGNTKNLWEQFWADLKRIAIRQISQIAAAQVLSGLFAGVQPAGSGGGGFGTFLSSFAPLLSAINPAAGALAFAGGKAASFLEQPGGVNIRSLTVNEADFTNDPTKLGKKVSQAIVPAINEERTDGR